MSERYVVKTTQNITHSALDCPVQLNKYQILFDNLLGKQFLRVALTCYTKIGISKTFLTLKCLDKSSMLIKTMDDVAISEQCSTLYGEFGKSALIEIPNDTAYASISISKVVLWDGDNSKWINQNENSVGETAKVEYTSSPFAKHIKRITQNKEMNLKYIPVSKDEYWQCTCGYLNSSSKTKCDCCNASKQFLFSIFDEEFLRKDSLYYEASDLYKAKKYLEAIKIFYNISDHKNSYEWLNYCVKNLIADTKELAKSKPSIKTFDECTENLKKIESFVDIQPHIAYIEQLRNEYQEKQYQSAINIANKNKTLGAYQKSINVLTEIGSYKDSDLLVATYKSEINKINKTNRRKRNIRGAIALATLAVMTVIAVLIPVFIDNKVYETRVDFSLEKCDGGYAVTDYNGDSKSVNIPDHYLGTPIVKIADNSFRERSDITSVTIGNNVKHIGYYAFSGCSGLTSITIPDSATSIGPFAFYDCSSLTSVTIGGSVTSIGDGAFYDCRALTNVTIGNKVMSIGYAAFYECGGLTSITIPDSVTSIGVFAFGRCSRMTSVVIPDSVTSIGYAAFDGCNGLESVYYKGTASDWASIYIDVKNNNCLISAAHYYYSDEEPTDYDNYWHYDENGAVVVWKKQEQA